jgi:hypothetical protein
MMFSQVNIPTGGTHRTTKTVNIETLYPQTFFKKKTRKDYP